MPNALNILVWLHVKTQYAPGGSSKNITLSYIPLNDLHCIYDFFLKRICTRKQKSVENMTLEMERSVIYENAMLEKGQPISECYIY